MTIFEAGIIFDIFFFNFTVVTQDYETGTSDAYVIIGNSALLKCEVPSFVGDFVSIVNWIDSKGNEHFPTQNQSKIPFFCLSHGIHNKLALE